MLNQIRVIDIFFISYSELGLKLAQITLRYVLAKGLRAP